MRNLAPGLPTAWPALWLAAATLAITPRSRAEPNVALWDTVAPLTDPVKLADRSSWQVVPRDLMRLEADPAKSSSDPGYYGRDYSFRGDAVVENRYLVALFSPATGRVAIYSKDEISAPSPAPQNGAGLGRKVLEFAAPDPASAPATARRIEVVRNAGDEVALRISSSTGDPVVELGVFTFGRNQIFEVRPGAGLRQVTLQTALDYGIVPTFIGDDLVFNPAEYASRDALTVPPENWFVGLFPGEDRELVMTWPAGKQQLKLRLGNDSAGTRRIQSLEFEPDGRSYYLAVLGAPGLWHRENLAPGFLEKDAASKWRRPFPARWKTQLPEEGLPTTFVFRETAGQIWRGVAGSYEYPVWFEGEVAHYHLSKKVPPAGESLIYCLEPQDTPLTVLTPVDVLQATLGRSACESVLDPEGRKLRTHHRRGADGVRRACTCGCTEAIQAVFEAGEEVSRKADIEAELADMVFFVHRHVERIDEYQRFAATMSRFFDDQAARAPELKPFLDGLAEVVHRIPEEYNLAKDNMKSFAYADELTRQTLALTERKDPNNLKAYLELLKAWRNMGGTQDYVLAQCHLITRRLFQQAGYEAVSQPQAAALAVEIRARCRLCLRNADGYEIWADY